MNIRNVCRASFCPKRTLSVLMFSNFLQGEQRQMRRSGDFCGASYHYQRHIREPEKEIVDFRIPLWNRKSLAFSCLSLSVNVIP
jgi:hypothetical protein